MTSQTLRVTKRDFAERLRSSTDPVLVIFRASWSERSQAMVPEAKDIVEDTNGDIDVIELDVDDQSRLANEYGVSGLPGFYFHYKDNLISRSIEPESIDEVKEALEELEQYW